MKKHPLKLSQEEKNKILNLHESYKNNPTPTLSESAIIGQTLYYNLLSEQPYDCGDKCAHRPPKVPPGNMVTAVMTAYFDGQKCRSLGWGGGAFWGSNGMEMCRACCEDKGGVGRDNIQYITDFPKKYRECMSDSIYFDQPYTGIPVPPPNVIPRKDYQKHYLFCTRQPYYGIPITNIDYVFQGKLVGITPQVCCGEEEISVDVNIEDIIKKDGTNKRRKKCVWVREPLDEPTLDENEKSINNIKVCHKGEKVEMIQEVLLKVIGCDLGKSGPNKDGIDGLFGYRTRKCVKKYQEQFDLEVDGIVGNETWSHMFPDADISITGSTEDVVSGKTIDQMTDIEIDAFIEEVKGEILPKKKCLALIVSTSKMIKKRPAEVDKLKGDESLILTLGNCLNDHNFPLIAGHRKRVKKTFGLKGKGN